ncbi:hypothetical protein ACHAPT_002694 [Fusarium lateritium]
MAEAIGVAGSIVGIVAFGQKLAVTLQTYVEAVAESSDRLREIASEINFTAAVLAQLQDLIQKDHDANSPIFHANGVRHLERLADKCKRIYTGIIILLNKAVGDGEKNNAKSNVSAPSVDNLSSRIYALEFRRKLAWPWLEPRIKRCQQELRQIKHDLLLQMQLASLAQFQLQHPSRTQGSFEQELALRALAQSLKREGTKYAKRHDKQHSARVEKATAPASEDSASEVPSR